MHSPWREMTRRVSPIAKIRGKRLLARAEYVKAMKGREFDDYSFELDQDSPIEITSDQSLTQYYIKQNAPNLVTSRLPSGEHEIVLDIDYPALLLPSQTKDHYHLYLNTPRPLTWKQYKKLLKVLAEVGVIERGYADASIAKKATCVRIPPLVTEVSEYPDDQHVSANSDHTLL